MTRSQEDWQYPEYEYQEDVENLSNYRHGGYHPVSLGHEFCDSRYLVVNKLGFGTYSTVWLARDRSSNRYVALKILEAEASSNEARILQHLEAHRKQKPDAFGEQYILKLLDSFHFDGPNGRHQCLVNEPAACSITFSKELSTVWVFPLLVARAIAAKVIMGLHFLHSSGVVHGADLHIGNILLKSRDIDDLLDAESVGTMLCSPEPKPIKRFDGAPLPASVPSHAVSPLQLGDACENITHANIVISDFGEAYLTAAGPPAYLNTPYTLCAPESLLKIGPLGKPADIWALACTLVEILGRSSLFEGMMPDRHDVMAEIVSALGKPPDAVWKAWKKRHEFFDEEGNWEIKPPRRHASFSRPLEMRIESRMRAYGGNLRVEEKSALARMLRGMLMYDSKERWTIEDVVKCEWMKLYGKPAIDALDSRVDKHVITDTGIVNTAPEVSRRVVRLPSDASSDSEIPILLESRTPVPIGDSPDTTKERLDVLDGSSANLRDLEASISCATTTPDLPVISRSKHHPEHHSNKQYYAGAGVDEASGLKR
ncbi:MAG: hypothetical protein Q9213_001374 [Squamulea squamosa]